VSFGLSDEHTMLRDAARDFLAQRSAMAEVRFVMETEAGFDRGLWSAMADLGWQAMAIPEDYGGAGFGMLEVGMVLEEMGRALTPAPFLSSVVLGANAVLIGGTDQQKHRLLPGVASGERRLALATVDIDAGWDPDPAATIAATTATGWELNGAKSHVLDGLTADTLIVAAGVDSEQIDLFVVDAETEGVSRSPLATMDLTRKQASIEFTNVHLGPEARLGASGSGSATLAALFDLRLRERAVSVRTAHRVVPGRQTQMCRHARCRRGSAFGRLLRRLGCRDGRPGPTGGSGRGQGLLL
jgi:alkylation response protein AidB-like acyl-CoA dehydrogenase